MEVLYYFKPFDKEKILSPHRILSPDAPPLSYRDAHLRVSVTQWFYSSRELRIFSMSRARRVLNLLVIGFTQESTLRKK